MFNVHYNDSQQTTTVWCVLISLKDTSQRGSDITRFGSAMAAFTSDYNDTYKQVHK